jgi:hypothetical protein
MVPQVSTISKSKMQRALLAAVFGGALGLGLGAVIPQSALAAPDGGGAPLSAGAVSTIQAQLTASIGNVESQGLSGPALDAAISAAIAQDVVSDVSTFGGGAAGEIASITISTFGVSAVVIGTGLGEAAVQIAKTDPRAADRIAKVVAAEGTPGEPGAFAAVVSAAGDTQLAEIAGGAPEVEGTSGGVGVVFGGSTPPPPPAPPPCATPSCS